MIFLLDENISPALCSRILELGYTARHVKDIGLLGAKDDLIFEFARATNEIIITHDLDYSRIHALSGSDRPSVILLRIEPISNDIVFNFLKENLDQLKDSLIKGAFVVVENDHIRIRDLPIKK